MTSSPDGTDTLARDLASCRNGERAALRRILDAEGGRLFAMATRMLRRRDLAEEAVQDAMVQIWMKAGQFSPDRGSARGWVFAIVRNRCLNILRDGKRLTTLGPEDLTAMQDARCDVRVEEGWERLNGKSRLYECLQALEADTRRAILLAYVSGFTHGEIAAMQKVPLGTCKSWIKRGLARLKGCLS